MRDMTVYVELRHPAKELRPNRTSRNNWRPRARAEKEARGRARIVALAGMQRAGAQRGVFEPVRYRITWLYKGTRPDQDNVVAACKAYLDGCADAFAVNDRAWTLEPVELVHDKERAGWMVIAFSDGETI